MPAVGVQSYFHYNDERLRSRGIAAKRSSFWVSWVRGVQSQFGKHKRLIWFDRYC